jgi:ABC-type multidrug transport system fused ATPase/permease subunit
MVLAGVAMGVVPFLYLALRYYMRQTQPQAERAKALESAMLGRLFETLTAIRLVKTFAREDYELGRFTSAAGRAMSERMTVVRQSSLFSFMVGAITVGGSSAVLALGGLHVLEGRLSVGTLLVIIAYLGFVYGPLSAIATTTGSLHEAIASARRVREVFDVPREDVDDDDAIVPARFRGAVRFEDVSFSYGVGRPVLSHVSFEAHPGETVALVGLSGAGKTTLVTLLGRFYEPTGGRVLIDGTDVRRFKLKALREQIAIVLQDSIMFSGSIGDNILYGRLDASDHEVVLAARAAHCEEFVAGMRRGFDTPLGDAGAGISGGQRQRVSIARAFLKDAPILILDEPTAALDTLAERAVLRALTELRQNRTTFVIAHRLSSVRDADRILVMDAGVIVAQGRHRELLESSSLYRELCSQLIDEPEAEARASSGREGA